jgi:CubicO group peptidase (beta-lactamase class C family)
VVSTKVDGHVAPGFEPVREAFAENFTARGEAGAGCAAYVGGELVVDLYGGVADATGRPYTERTLQMVASATKGALAICAHQLVEQSRLDLDAPVTRYWPEFRTPAPVRWLLTHQVGLPYVDAPLTAEDLLAWTPVTAALAEQAPVWEPGTRHGYHALTYGWLVGEVVARVAGRSAGTVFAEQVAGPLGLDMAIGLPAADHGRVAPIRPYVRPEGTPPDELTQRLMEPGGVAARAFFLTSGLNALLNDPRLWAAEVPAANGMATARALARMYAAVIGEVDGVRLLRPETVDAARTEQVAGQDVVTGYATRFGLGFQLPIPYRPMAGGASFGHYGLGGSVGFADPERGFSFGYATSQVGAALPADPRTVAVIGALVSCL